MHIETGLLTRLSTKNYTKFKTCISKESADTGYRSFPSFSEIQHATQILKSTKNNHARSI